MFDDRLVTNRFLLDYKKSPILSGGHIGIFPKGEPYELSPKLKTQLFGLLLEEICVEKMFDDRLVTNRAILDYKKGLFDQLAILVFFQREDAMNLVQN